MPPLPGFSDNAFAGHGDFKTACIALLRALKPYQSPGGARIQLPLATGTHFDHVAAQLEGYARPLWAVGALLHGRTLTPEEHAELAEPYIHGLANGTDPDHPEYWGPVVVRDQRMVEMEIISFALLAAPDAFFHGQSSQARSNITNWLKTLNGKDFPVTNWLWFRVMTNLALVKVCGVPLEELNHSMKTDLDALEAFYRDEGWAADGLWNDHGRQADYYSSSFAIQFSQLLYAKLAEDLDPVRCETFRQRARAFSESFWRYFDKDGAAIPFGRSLAYRFAIAGFWSAAAFAEVDLPAPVDSRGTVKGLLLRHFRWWAAKHDIFNIDGTLTIGFAFPNMYMSEDYNSPQSPYWAMKSFAALGLSDTHPFWAEAEMPLPSSKETSVTAVKPPLHILCHTERHHFLLSMGQFCPWPLKATEAKYGKFAYSSQFGFSVPTGPLVAQMAPDSTMALSKDEGDTWRVPWKVEDPRFGTAMLVNGDGTEETVHTLASTWRPWKDSSLQISTTLVAPSSRWPDWHVRIHRFTHQDHVSRTFCSKHGGFAIQGRASRAGEVLPLREHSANSPLPIDSSQEAGLLEGTFKSDQSALVCSDAGASGIRFLGQALVGQKLTAANGAGEVLKPDANTNLIWQRTLLPTFEVELQDMDAGDSFVVMIGVFAAHGKGGLKGEDVKRGWDDSPRINLSELGLSERPFIKVK